MIRLDVPIWNDLVIARQIDALIPKGENTVPWVATMNLVNTGSTILRIFSQIAVLFGKLAFFESKVTGCCSVCFRLPAMLRPASVTPTECLHVKLVCASGVRPRLMLRGFIRLSYHHTRRRICQDGKPYCKRLVSRSTHCKELVTGGLAEIPYSRCVSTA